MRSLLHFGWLTATLAACALGTAADDVTTPIPDSGPKIEDAGPTPKDASPPKDGGGGFQDASPPNDAAPPIDSGNQGSCATPFSGTLATFDFSGETGKQVSTPATSTASGVTAGAIGRSSALTATSGANSINASNWTTANKLDATRYYTFTLTPAGGCTLDLSSLSITTSASGTGPTLAALATSDDSFAATSPVSIGATANPAVSVNGATGAVEIRVYGYAASAAAGTLRISNTLTVTGSLQ
ncbi:MAG TPA: hypothetical protein VGH28_16780 [Polyangiaceae bacterium]|jgi:hypothetical protein